MPYSTCSMATFEQLVQVINVRGIAPVMGERVKSTEYPQWMLEAFLHDAFAAEMGEARDLFPEILDTLTAGILDPGRSVGA